jgi:hypothetical protein
VYGQAVAVERRRRHRNRKGRDKLVGTGVGDVVMAANALSFLVGVILPLGGAIWLVLH